MPLPNAILPSTETPYVRTAAKNLEEYYRNAQMIDFEHEMFRLWIEYQRRLLPYEMKDRPPEDLKAVLDGLDKKLTKHDAEFAARLEHYLSQPGSTARQRIQAALGHGLPGEVLKLIQTADLDKEFGVEARGIEFLAIQIRLKAGMLEDAVAAMNSLQQKLRLQPSDPQAKAINDQVARQLVDSFAEAQRLAGDYASHGKWLDLPYPPLPPLTPAQKELIARASQSRENYNLCASGTLHATLGGGAIAFDRILNDGFLLQNWQNESNHDFRRAQSYMLEGRLAGAKACFEQSLKPLGMPIPIFFQNRATVERYLKLIDSAK
jgi:hypothetical protein